LDPRDSQVRYAVSARTSFDVGDGNLSCSPVGRRSSSASTRPVAFSLLRKQSTTRSARVNKRPARLLYSGNIPATPTSGSERSRWPPFKWQLLHETLLGVKRAASTGVLVKIRNPHRISADSFESSNVGSVSGFCGTSQAVTIVVVEGISGPLNGTPDAVVRCGAREHAAVARRSATAGPNGSAFARRVMG
jgi:hypothetical protein